MLRQGVPYRKCDNRDFGQAQMQLVVPKPLNREVLVQLYDIPTSGHLGVTKTLSKLRTRFYWVNCRSDVEEWCRKCDACTKRKGPQRKSRAPLNKYVCGAPMERLAVGHFGPSTC